ncbi:hypothetical protein JW960_19025 [candidate division KSB1 bacterium]|nr:hypothetical protein [candidate division KSB1 bacterium]
MRNRRWFMFALFSFLICLSRNIFAQFSLQFPETSANNYDMISVSLPLPTGTELFHPSMRMVSLGSQLNGIVPDSLFDRFRNPAFITDVTRVECIGDFSYHNGKTNRKPISYSFDTQASSIFGFNMPEYDKQIVLPSGSRQKGMGVFAATSKGTFGFMAYFDRNSHQSGNYITNLDRQPKNSQVDDHYSQQSGIFHMWYGVELSERRSIGIDYSVGKQTDRQSLVDVSIYSSTSNYWDSTYVNIDSTKVQTYQKGTYIAHNNDLVSHTIRFGGSYIKSTTSAIDLVVKYEFLHDSTTFNGKNTHWTESIYKNSLNYPMHETFNETRSGIDAGTKIYSHAVACDVNYKKRHSDGLIFHYLGGFDCATWKLHGLDNLTGYIMNHSKSNQSLLGERFITNTIDHDGHVITGRIGFGT